MPVSIEYFFADSSSQPMGNLSRSAAVTSVLEFPWDEQLALFNESDDYVGPEVRFGRSAQTGDINDDVDAYASIAKFEDGKWLIVAGSTMPGKILGIFPTTKKADIIMDNLNWQDVQDFIKRFYEASPAELFAWMKARE